MRNWWKKRASDAARKQVGPGTYTAEFMLHVYGGMDVGDDYTRRVPPKPWDLLAVALSHLNDVTIESITRRALNAAPDIVESVKAKAGATIKVIKGTTESVCAAE